jgi:flagellar hook protein FlgE
MSLFGTMKTAVSGMSAQANRLSTVGDNIANSSTTGYKRASTSFSSLVLPSTAGAYNSGGVTTSIQYSISEQGALEYTTSDTDLAIQGDGFFIVQDDAGNSYLTRAGSFTIDDNGNLVNSQGYSLMGYSYDGGDPAVVVNGYAGLEAINISGSGLTASESTTGVFAANLDADSDVVTGDLPSANLSTSTYTHKSSLVAYDSQGREVTYDFYYTKTNDNEWEVSVYLNSEATDQTGFPYSPTGQIGSATLIFNDDGTLDTTSGDSGVAIADSVNNMDVEIDFSEMTQLATDFAVNKANVDGSAASAVKSVEIDGDGVVYAKYSDGSTTAIYRIALGTVQSPDNLKVVSGNMYLETADSGVVTIGYAETGQFGTIISGALESSNVDLASELTEMIESQRSYTANSKVFQTGSDLMDVLINLKR